MGCNYLQTNTQYWIAAQLIQLRQKTKLKLTDFQDCWEVTVPDLSDFKFCCDLSSLDLAVTIAEAVGNLSDIVEIFAAPGLGRLLDAILPDEPLPGRLCVCKYTLNWE